MEIDNPELRHKITEGVIIINERASNSRFKAGSQAADSHGEIDKLFDNRAIQVIPKKGKKGEVVE